MVHSRQLRGWDYIYNTKHGMMTLMKEVNEFGVPTFTVRVPSNGLERLVVAFRGDCDDCGDGQLDHGNCQMELGEL